MTTTKASTTKTAARKLPVGQRIRWARERKGISQERLAVMAGTSRRHMIRIEKGEHVPGNKLIARIAAATEQPEAFFGGSSDDEEESPLRFTFPVTLDLPQELLDEAVAKALANRPVLELELETA